VLVSCSICVLCVVHFVHRKRKCLTVSFICPQAHLSDSAAPIRYRYPLSRAIPVRGWASMFASFRLKPSYNMQVYLPGSGVSISLKYLLMPSGGVLLRRCFANAELSAVDLTQLSIASSSIQSPHGVSSSLTS